MYTTVYLAYTYDLDIQWKILKRWCKAAGDKFNENKMEVNTIGIHITKEGEVTRILGGWIGNAINDKSTWSKALVKIADYFKLWGRGNPMLFGQRLIAKMFGGGASQYLTTIQGMPKPVENTLQRIINKFVWDGKWTSTNQQILRASICNGEVQLLDIKLRNEAIELMWLKKYLQLREERPLWESISDLLIEEDIPRSSNINQKLIIFFHHRSQNCQWV